MKNNLFPISKYKLCYISGNKAYFTTQTLSKQSGDGWYKLPYEHNSSSPDEYNEEYDKGKKPWSIASLYFECDFSQDPSYCETNSPYSVEMINKKQVPWLIIVDETIYAGTKYLDFYDLIVKHGGRCWLDPVQEFTNYNNRKSKSTL